MVADVQDEVGFDTEDEDLPDEPEAESEPQEEVAEPDPLAEIRQRVDGAASKDELERLRQQVASELGRAQRLEAKLSTLGDTASRTQLAEIEARIDASDALLISIVESQIASPLVDDATRAALTGTRNKFSEANGKRAEQRLRAELTAQVLDSLPKPQVQTAPETSADAMAATERVVGYAEAKGVNPQDIPASAWNLLPNETFDQAIARVRGVVDSLAEQDAATAQVATRRSAAGNGSPSRSGGAGQSDMDKYRAYGAGDIDLSDAEVTALEARLNAAGLI